MKKFAIHTLGCKVNQAESDELLGILLQLGLEETKLTGFADYCFINSCTVTAEADRKTRQIVRRIKRENPRAQIFLMGCWPENKENIKNNEISAHVTYILNKDKKNIPEIIGLKPPDSTNNFIKTQKTRAFLKIQEGCDNACSYCIIPHVRGKSRSVGIEKTIQSLRQLEDNNYNEVVLTGINIAQYGRDISPECSFAALTEKILNISKIKRIRISSIEPFNFPYEILNLFERYSGKLCRHFHLPIQHVSDNILKKMNRPINFDETKRLIETIFEKVPEICITLDIILGFPGETEETIEELYSFLLKYPFFSFHIFPFSRRPGTQAFTFPETCGLKPIKLLCRRFQSLSDTKRRSFLEKFEEKDIEVLVENKNKKGFWQGHSDNYLKICFETNGELKNKFVTIHTVSAGNDFLQGFML